MKGYIRSMATPITVGFSLRTDKWMNAVDVTVKEMAGRIEGLNHFPNTF